MSPIGLLLIFAVIIILLIIYEFRLRRPDQIVLGDVGGKIIRRKGKFYPRHFSLGVPATIFSSVSEFESEARGKLPIKIKLTFTTAADENHLTELVRAGGWSENLVEKASGELGLLIQTLAKEFCEKLEIEELSGKDLHDYLQKNLNKVSEKLGLQLISLNIHSIEPLDTEIAEAMQQQEAARIREKTEKINQKARLEATKSRVEADEKIKLIEHQLQLKQMELKKKEQEKEAELARYRVEKELERRRMQFEMEQKELEVFEEHPELLLLSPQLARLAEASQQLKNARTVVSLAGLDQQKASHLFDVFEQFVQKVLNQKQKAK